MRNIFGSFDKADHAKGYIDSMSRVSDAQFYIIQYLRNGKFEEVKFGDNVRLFQMDKKYPGNTGKMNDWYNTYKKLEIPEDEWCIFTDMHDIVFQQDIPELNDHYIALVCSEGKKFGEVGFWRNILPEHMYDWDAVNCGSFAMNALIFEGYLTVINLDYQNMIEWKNKFTARELGTFFPFTSQYVTDTIRFNIGSIFNGIADTYIFNNYIRSLLPDLVAGWKDVACYNFFVEKGLAEFHDGKLYVPNGDSFPIAHFNGENPVTTVQKQFVAPATERK